MLTTTFAVLRQANACKEGYGKLARHLGGVSSYGEGTGIPVSIILESNGLDDTLWTISHACGEEGEKIAHIFACDCAEHVLSLYEKHYPNDFRPRKAVETKRLWVAGLATNEERAAAWVAARDAARDAAKAAARDAAKAAAWAAAWDTARTAAWDTAWDTARAAARDAARDTAGAAAWAAAWAAEKKWQINRLRTLLSCKRGREI